MPKETKVGCGSENVGFTGLLTLLFIALKLTDIIDWSWWWVLSPVWIGFSLSLIVALLIVLLDKP